LIDDITYDKDYYMLIMAVTDIVNEGSYIFYTSSREKLVRMIFEEENVHQGIYVDKCVSRKKQIVPKVINALNQIKQ
ncbi:MAG TPA: DHHA2 domain-containing protein, partial [Lachnospiraceae bacterium]|nr:DHHA2 domain-containing protein [Lachnospiraceae bacterium]